MSTEPQASRAFEALADRYRRQLLLGLLEANPAGDDELDPVRLLRQDESTDDRDVTQTTLRHVHLPKLADLGFVEWDRDSGDISTGPNWAEIAPLLRLIRDHQDELPDV